MSGLSAVLILGSVRQARMADRVSKLVSKAVKQNTKLSLTTLDPEKLDPKCLMNRQPMHFQANPKKESPKWMHDTKKVVEETNGFIVVTPEYNGMLPPALLNLLNSLPPPSFRNRPVGIVTYTMGTTGAMRALNVCRPYLCELGMLPVPGYVPIPLIHETLDEEGNTKNDTVKENLVKLVKNVEWFSKAIAHHKKSGNAFVS